jgi:hypothetical protein
MSVEVTKTHAKQEFRVVRKCACRSGKYAHNCCQPETWSAVQSLTESEIESEIQLARQEGDSEAVELLQSKLERLVRARHEQERMRQLERLSEQDPTTPKTVETFYDVWKTCTGYRNSFNGVRSTMARLKERIILHMLAMARERGWLVWSAPDYSTAPPNNIVLYIETFHGQCSWHVDKSYGAETREDLHWSGLRNSDLVIRRCLGEELSTMVPPEGYRAWDLYVSREAVLRRARALLRGTYFWKPGWKRRKRSKNG